MKEKILWAAVAALALLSAGQAYYIFTRPAAAGQPGGRPAETPAYEDPWKELEAWRREVRARLKGGGALGPGDFDSFFGDAFFGRRAGPFEQLERIHRQMLESLEDAQRDAFGESWGKWSGERLGMEDFKTSVYGGEKEIVMYIDVPGLEGKKADINVTRDRIRLSFTARSSSEEKKNGGSFRRESSRSYLKILPVPEGADGEKARVELEGERIKLTFPRLPDKAV